VGGGQFNVLPRTPVLHRRKGHRGPSWTKKKPVARLLTKNTHIAMGTAVERQLTWATIDYLQAMQCDGKRKEKTFARLTQTGESFSLRLPSHWICGFRELS